MPVNSQSTIPYRDWDLSQLGEIIQIGILVVDEQGYIQYMNPCAEHLLNSPFEVKTHSHVATLLPNSGVLDALEFGEEMVRFLNIGKKKIAVHSKPIYGKHQHIMGSICTLHDLNVLESNDPLSTPSIWDMEIKEIIGMSSDSIMICDRSGKIHHVNEAFENLFEIKQQEAYGRFIQDFSHMHTISSFIESYAFKMKSSISVEIEIHHADKKAIVESRTIYKENGEVWRIICRVKELDESNQEIQVQTGKNMIAEKEQASLFEKHDFLRNIIAKSPAMKNIVMKASHVATVDTNVLILGESGVGKEVVTEMIHKMSDRKNGPLIKINCGAIPETLLESELFGYEKGSFTGASTKGKVGLFELAQGGTIFLDEIGEIPLNLQVKLLRAIQQREIMRVGGTKTIKLDVRLIAATNRNLEEMVQEGKFREDLYYRINVVPFMISPLRERREDIDALVMHFLKKFNEQYGFHKKIDLGAMDALVSYSWPGNVRQLENVVERMVIMSPSDLLEMDQVPQNILSEMNQQGIDLSVKRTTGAFKDIMAEYEKEVLKGMLKIHKTIRKTAKELELDHSTLVRKFKKYNIKYEEVVKD